MQSLVGIRYVFGAHAASPNLWRTRCFYWLLELKTEFPQVNWQRHTQTQKRALKTHTLIPPTATLIFKYILDYLQAQIPRGVRILWVAVTTLKILPTELRLTTCMYRHTVHKRYVHTVKVMYIQWQRFFFGLVFRESLTNRATKCKLRTLKKVQ